MATRRQPAADPMSEAQAIARAHNMFVVSRGEQFSLYRRTPARPVFLGARSNESALHTLVKRCAATS